MKENSLYVIAIVAVVAMVGLVIMATGNSTVVAAEENMMEDNTALTGQSINTGMCPTTSNDITVIISSQGVQGLLDDMLYCTCDQLQDIIITLSTLQINPQTQMNALAELTNLYNRECALASGDLGSTRASESSGLSVGPTRGVSGTTSNNDIMDVFWGTISEPAQNEYVNKYGDSLSAKYGDCSKLAESMQQPISESQAQRILDDAGKNCDCEQIRVEFIEYKSSANTWNDLWTQWMINHCISMTQRPLFS